MASDNLATVAPEGFADPTAAKRQAAAKRSRLYRQRKRQTPAGHQAAITAVTTLTPHATVTPHRHVSAVTLVAALALATCSAGMSITGLTAIFAGAFWPVVAMGSAFEAGKLSAVAWLGSSRHGVMRHGALRLALVTLVVVLMALNSVGVYGFLSRAHLEHKAISEVAVDRAEADINAKLAVRQALIEDINKRLKQIDAAIDEATKRGRTKTAMALIDEQRSRRAELVSERQAAAKVLAELQVRVAAIDGERKAIQADLGPVRYLATLIGTSDDVAMRWFILVVALLLDPAAVLLLLTATGARRHEPLGSPRSGLNIVRTYPSSRSKSTHQ